MFGIMPLKKLSAIIHCLAMLLTTILPLGTAFAKEGHVAKVLIMRGDVKGTFKGKTTQLKRGAKIPEGMTIATGKKSFAKLLFIDKSQMSLGPTSEMAVTQFPKKKAGILTLVKGQLRSKVTKNYMNMKDKKKSKLFVKTKTAAMGVRGTDFQVNFNEENNATALVTFEGAVAMAQIDPEAPVPPAQNNLEKIVSSNAAVMVKQGQYSGAAPSLARVTVPIKISPSQLTTLEQNKDMGSSGNAPAPKVSAQKQFRAPVPPGVDGKQFANTESSVDKQLESTIGKSAASEVKSATPVVAENAPPPEGFFDKKTGTLAPKSGGLIDLKNALYIPPPKEAKFDPVSGTFEMPKSMGRVDPKTGAYVNDHYKLRPDGKFVAKDTPVATTATSAGSRTPSSEKGAAGTEGASSASTSDSKEELASAPGAPGGTEATADGSEGAPPPPMVMTDPAAMDLPEPPSDFKLDFVSPSASPSKGERTPANAPSGAAGPQANAPASGPNGGPGGAALPPGARPPGAAGGPAGSAGGGLDFFAAPPPELGESEFGGPDLLAPPSGGPNGPRDPAAIAAGGEDAPDITENVDFNPDLLLQDSFNDISNEQESGQAIQNQKARVRIIINAN